MDHVLPVDEWSQPALLEALTREPWPVKPTPLETELLRDACALVARLKLVGVGAVVVSVDRADGLSPRALVITDQKVSYVVFAGDERTHVVAGPGHADVAYRLVVPPKSVHEPKSPAEGAARP